MIFCEGYSIYREDYIICREHYIIFREYYILFREDYMIFREGYTIFREYYILFPRRLYDFQLILYYFSRRLYCFRQRLYHLKRAATIPGLHSRFIQNTHTLIQNTHMRFAAFRKQFTFFFGPYWWVFGDAVRNMFSFTFNMQILVIVIGCRKQNCVFTADIFKNQQWPHDPQSNHILLFSVGVFVGLKVILIAKFARSKRSKIAEQREFRNCQMFCIIYELPARLSKIPTLLSKIPTGFCFGSQIGVRAGPPAPP